MRNFSCLSIVLSIDGSENPGFSSSVVEVVNGNSTVQVSNLEAALKMVPDGSKVNVVVNGSVSNQNVYNIARAISEGNVFVVLDLSSVTELPGILGSPFNGNLNLVGLDFPMNTVSINSQWVADCKNLETVTIPASVKKIGAQAFSGCEKLSSLKFADPAGWFALKDGNAAEEIKGLEKTDDNPYRFTLFSSPFRNCVLQKN